MPAKTRRKSGEVTLSTVPKLSNAELLRLAQKHKPPQAWYDEAANPFKSKAKR